MGTVNATAAGGCSWTAVSNAGWITVTSGANGSGNGAVGYSVAVNSGVARTGSITVAGQTFTVMQSAPELINKIVFVSTRDGNPEIYSMNSDGSGPTRLTNHSAVDAFPAWSPNHATL
jgi:Tol biopolymer transport system component